jgi:hypothetical protein
MESSKGKTVQGNQRIAIIFLNLGKKFWYQDNYIEYLLRDIRSLVF